MSDSASPRRRVIAYWRMNWDYWLLVALVLIIAVTVGGILGAIQDTIRQIVAGY